MPTPNSRRTAAFIVARWLATREFPGDLLPQGGPDRGFVQDLVYTVVRRLRPLRAVLGELLRTWPKGELEALLLVGAAQILYMPDVPDFAAVSETVAAAKLSGRARRLDRVVNGVLRNLVRRRADIEARLAAAPLAARESYPGALVRRWVARYGAADAERLARWHNTPAETWLAYRDGRFERLPHGRRVAEAEGYDAGDFIVQDPATAGAVDLLALAPGLSVLDFCAAPGGKTAQIAWRLGGTGRLVAHEVNPRRRARLQENLARLRLANVEVVSGLSPAQPLPPPASPLPPPTSRPTPPTSPLPPPPTHLSPFPFPLSPFDRVLVDAPCSNTGVLRRRPDARWRFDAAHLRQLVALQAQILDAAAAFVAPGGRLVYSTCSNEPEENDGQVAAFLARHPGFAEAARRESVPFATGHDGAFACALVRAGPKML